MKAFFGILLVATTSFAGEIYKCTNEDKTLFGDVTLTVNSKPEVRDPVIEDLEKPNASLEIYLALDEANKTFSASCVQNPSGDNEYGCVVIGEEDGKVYPFGVFGLKLDVLAGVLFQHSAPEEGVAYSCEKLAEKQK